MFSEYRFCINLMTKLEKEITVSVFAVMLRMCEMHVNDNLTFVITINYRY